jgi:hypothetical protein
MNLHRTSRTRSWPGCVSVVACLVAALPLPALAQSGTVDQVSLAGTNQVGIWMGSTLPHVLQQEVRAGMAGRLNGFGLYVGGLEGVTIPLRLRAGETWSTNPVLWETVHTIPGGTLNDMVYFDVSAADIQLSPGSPFVIEIELQGLSGMNMSVTMPPCYPYEFFVDGAPYTGTTPTRFQFKTWMDVPPVGVNYCEVVPSSLQIKSRIWASGSSSVATNDLTVLAGPTPYTIGILYYGNAQIQVPFGNGYRCVAGQTQRLAPAGAPTCGILSRTIDWNAQPAFLAQPGTTLYFQSWFRDPFSGPFGFNLSDGYAIQLLP